MPLEPCSAPLPGEGALSPQCYTGRKASLASCLVLGAGFPLLALASPRLILVLWLLSCSLLRASLSDEVLVSGPGAGLRMAAGVWGRCSQLPSPDRITKTTGASPPRPSPGPPMTVCCSGEPPRCLYCPLVSLSWCPGRQGAGRVLFFLPGEETEAQGQVSKQAGIGNRVFLEPLLGEQTS